MKFTANDIELATPDIKKKKDSIWGKCGARQLSYYFAAFFLNIGLTPNMVSILSIVDALTAAVFMSIAKMPFVVAGIILLNAFVLLDNIDGNMARALNKSSYMGEFYDAVGGYSIDAFTLLGVGICAYNFGRVIFITDVFLLVVVSSVGSICNIFSRLIYQKYTANELIANYKKGKPLIRENDSYYQIKHNFNFSYLRMEIDRQAEGFYPLLVALAFIFRFLDIIVMLYSLYYFIALMAVYFIYCRKATRFDNNIGDE